MHQIYKLSRNKEINVTEHRPFHFTTLKKLSQSVTENNKGFKSFKKTFICIKFINYYYTKVNNLGLLNKTFGLGATKSTFLN